MDHDVLTDLPFDFQDALKGEMQILMDAQRIIAP